MQHYEKDTIESTQGRNNIFNKLSSIPPAGKKKQPQNKKEGSPNKTARPSLVYIGINNR